MYNEYLAPKAFLICAKLTGTQNNLEAGDFDHYLSLLGSVFCDLPCGGKGSFRHYLKELNKREARRFMDPKDRSSLSKTNVRELRKSLSNGVLDSVAESIEVIRESRMEALTAETILEAVENGPYLLPEKFVPQWRLATDYRLSNGIKVMLLLMASLFQRYYEEDHKNEPSVSTIVDNYLRYKIESAARMQAPVREILPASEPFASLKKYADTIQDHFGRLDSLKNVQEILFEKKLCVISGKPGFGKSSLALKYACNAKSTGAYADILFLACENIESLKKSSGISEVKDAEIEDALDSYLDQWFKSTNGRLLLVFDNLGKDRYQIDPKESCQSPDYLRDLLTGLIKRKFSCNQRVHFLVTSIHDDLFYEKEYENCTTEIAEFTPEEAAAYLTAGIDFQYTDTEIRDILSSFSPVPIILKAVKTLARKRRSFRLLCPEYVQKQNDLYYLLKSMLQLADPVYSAALKAITCCFKDDIPADFISTCVQKALPSLNLTMNIAAEIRRENEAYHILDVYEEDGHFYYSIHQTFQAELRRIWLDSYKDTIQAVFQAYEEGLNFYSYYGIRDFQAVRNLKPHIEAFWRLLDEGKKEDYKELWLHYRWIAEYFLSTGNSYLPSPFEDDRGYSLRFECDRLANGLEDGDFNRRDLEDFVSFLSEEESMQVITDDLMVRCRVSIFLMVLITTNETNCMNNRFSDLPLKEYVLETVTLIDGRIKKMRDKKRAVFFIEHACMLRSMLSIDERAQRTRASHHKAVELNSKVLELLEEYTRGVHAKLPSGYDPGFLHYFALNLQTVPCWESPSHFLEAGSESEIPVLEDAFVKTKECNEFYLENAFYERAETELSNLFDICGKLAKAYRGRDPIKCSEYVKKSEQYLQERFEVRSRTHYLAPEFMHSYLYKRYMFYTQYGLVDPAIDTVEEKYQLLCKAEVIVEEWEKWLPKLPTNSQALFYRMKGILYRKLLDLNFQTTAAEREEHLCIAKQCFDQAIRKQSDQKSVVIINTIEKAFALKSFGRVFEAWELLDSVKPLVDETGAWKAVYQTAVRYTQKEISEQKNTSE